MAVDAQNVVLVASAAVVASKVLGPTLAQIGDDFKALYVVGRDKLLAAGYRKIKDIEDGKRANLRVVRDVLRNGSFAESEVCTEYFAGILASSRSDDGKCDDMIQFVDVVKALSSKQLHLHYVIYNCFNKLWCQAGTPLNVGLNLELGAHRLWISRIQLDKDLGLHTDSDLSVLLKESLISSFEAKGLVRGDETLPYVNVTPTTFGVLLYACAHNRFDEWRKIDCTDFGDFDAIQLPKLYAPSEKDFSVLVWPDTADPT